MDFPFLLDERIQAKRFRAFEILFLHRSQKMAQLVINPAFGLHGPGDLGSEGLSEAAAQAVHRYPNWPSVIPS